MPICCSIPRGKGGISLRMKLVYNKLAPIFMFLRQWMDCSSSCLFSSYINLFYIIVHKVRSDGRPNVSSYGRKATIGEFYTVILPSLKRLHCDLSEDTTHERRSHNLEMAVRKISDADLEREDECGICLEPCTKMVLPNCCHAMCINCYHDWNTRSESCPFCRGSLKRVNSEDLWVLTCGNDVVDTQSALKEDVQRFYLFINSLPKDIPDALFIMYYDYLF
ncbi:RING-H2 finger protein ATL47 isoform X2 [Morus notabilis]|uniref:RING-H2 finger protein ATL47 isoform X2 n=1 Tax=Morus notabilis TaxID=981085 RepID=UPI000CED3F84|nr:RING-H2 finger protein ATL47 isoform X2 [Morus notabilis]